jgi:hypothetical protein
MGCLQGERIEGQDHARNVRFSIIVTMNRRNENEIPIETEVVPSRIEASERFVKAKPENYNIKSMIRIREL